jgi:hypothetical protein
MCPHADNLHGLTIVQSLINQSMLNIDPAGIRTCQIAYKFLVWWGIFEGILFKDFQKSFGLRFQS